MKHNRSMIKGKLIPRLPLLFVIVLGVGLLLSLGPVPVAQAATTWYVDDDNCPGSGDGSSGNPFCTIQEAVTAASSGDTINVAAGTYAEGITLTPGTDLTIVGAGRDVVTWICPSGGYCIDGSMSGYTGSMNYEISGFTFNVRSDPNATWGAGIGIRRAQNGPLNLSIHDNRFIEDRASGDDTHWGTSMLLCHNRFAGRDGSGNPAVRVYNNIDETVGGMTMSNSQAYDIYDNVFDGASDAIYNGHGCPDTTGQTFGDHHIYRNVFKNASDALHPGGLTPAIDWQYYGGGGGTHLPSIIEENLFEDNDTAIRFVMDTDMTYPAHVVRNNSFVNNGLAIRVDGDYASTLNASGNWWGTNDPAGVAAAVSGSVDYTPWLASGTDTSGDSGFQGDFSELWVDDDSPQTGSTGRVQEGVNLVSGSIVNVAAGTYNERVTINKSVDLRGAQYGVDPAPSGARTNPANESIITEAGLSTPNPDVLVEIPSGITDVTIDGFTLNGDPTNTTADTSTVRAWDDNTNISNNIIDGMYAVLYKGNDNLNVHQNRMTVNKLGVTVQPNPASNVTISDNVISLGSSPVGDESATYMTSCDQCNVTGNTATGFVNGRGTGGSNLTNLTVSGNTFTGNKDAVSIWGNSTFIAVSDNDLSSSLRYGINIKGQDVTIEDNLITSNGDIGINIDRHVINTERVAIHCNIISENTNYGVKVNTANVTEIIDGEDNWWGDASGPLDNSDDTATGGLYNPTGLGDEVTDNVDYDPWAISTPPCEPTAISLASFTAEANDGRVMLIWETGTEIDNAGFNLYRAASPDGPWRKINSMLIAAEGDAISGASYTFADTPGRGTFYYQLEDVDYFGVSTLHAPVKAEMGAAVRAPWFRPTMPQF